MLICLAIVALVLAGCASPKKDFEAAASVNTSAAWEAYLSRHGRSAYAPQARQRLNVIRQYEAYAEQINQSIRRAQSSGKSVREQVRYLAQERAQSPDKTFFDRYTAQLGLGYLSDVVFARRNVVLVADEITGTKKVIGGNWNTHGIYSSVAYAGEPLVPISGGYRGLLTHPSIAERPGSIKAKGAAGREIYGKIEPFLKESGLSRGDVLTETPRASLPGSYRTAKLEGTYEQGSGGIYNLAQAVAAWANKNPEASAAIGLLMTAAMLNNPGR
jgi:hypothetical protein